jgi:hypothetical protein
MEQSMSLPDTLRISLAGFVLGALTLGGCSESSHDEHAGHDDHDHGAEMHDESGAVDPHAGHDHGDVDGDNEHADGRTDVYTGILGELKSIPTDGVAGDPAKIRHVQIPEFKNAAGEIPVTTDGVPGMRSMTMPFPFADGVSTDGFAVGDKVEFNFVVTWENGAASWEITEISKLDPATEIEYTNVKAAP